MARARAAAPASRRGTARNRGPRSQLSTPARGARPAPSPSTAPARAATPDRRHRRAGSGCGRATTTSRGACPGRSARTPAARAGRGCSCACGPRGPGAGTRRTPRRAPPWASLLCARTGTGGRRGDEALLHSCTGSPGAAAKISI